ncbi:leucine rich repeats (6 copies) [Kordia sp. SMS9]|uniref:leucine-rich repeat domain-containing protein n=1 Tax=Kordia sp. SMS9 TaxID=2282170 RepID=UPI000E0D9DDB|nr:leucine-rich repeat domain-containing protein [Kordia sp. SMS9]AXG72224.1 leucine rich repeats (6 copies) [Kordia sp. SMS9]
MKKELHKLLCILLVCVTNQISFAQPTERGGGTFFIVNGIEYEATNFDPNEVALVFGTPEGAFTVPSSVTFQGVDFSVVEIESGALYGALATSITLPATIRAVGDYAFEDSAITQVTALGTTAPTLGVFAFNDNSLVTLTVPTGEEGSYLENGWLGFATINGTAFNFEVNNITYGINSLSSNTVAVLDSSITGSTAVIPTTVTFNSTTYTVSEIANAAFENNQLTGVTIPTTVTKIGERAFKNNQLTGVTLPTNLTELGASAFQTNQIATISIPPNITVLKQNIFLVNQLTSVTIPAAVTSIEGGAFNNNPITTFDVLATTPPTIRSFSFSNPATIDVTVPVGTEAAYTAAGWNMFRTINGITQFRVGSEFTENNFNYRVTAINPNEVEITGGTNIPQDLVIDASVTTEGLSFSVVKVGVSAFENKNLTSVQLPNTMRFIDDFAFQSNQISSLTIPTSVTRIDFRAFRLNQIGGNLLIPNTVTALGNAAFEANNLSSISISENLSAIGNQVFRSNQLTTVTIPANINSLGDNCFRSNPLTEVIVLNPTPLTFTGNDPFQSIRGNIALTVPASTELNYLVSGWTGFASINGQDPAFFNEFEENNVTYRITTLNPNEVAAVGTISPGALEIPSIVTNATEAFTVKTIATDAFRDSQLTSISLPSSVTSIGQSAFQNNQLTTVILPASITNVARRSFRDNPLKTVILEGFTPPTVNNQSNANNTFSNRSNIDLYVRSGTVQPHLNGGWSNFKSISGVSKALVLDVYLQGASLNPFTGEENLMRDDLRVAGFIPTTSPYGDGATVNATVFDITGEDAIVDWVLVELRSAIDNTNVVESVSALLQRDGDVVGTDGVLPIQFTTALDDYVIAVKHRNHLGIASVATTALRSTANVLEFSNANNPVTFGTNAQTDAGMPNNTIGMWAGNVNGDNFVQYLGGTPDTTAILSAALNDPGNFLNFSTFIINGYNDNDVDMNGITQYEGGSADSPLILQNVLAHPGNFLNFSTFQILEQLPNDN